MILLNMYGWCPEEVSKVKQAYLNSIPKLLSPKQHGKSSQNKAQRSKNHRRFVSQLKMQSKSPPKSQDSGHIASGLKNGCFYWKVSDLLLIIEERGSFLFHVVSPSLGRRNNSNSSFSETTTVSVDYQKATPPQATDPPGTLVQAVHCQYPCLNLSSLYRYSTLVDS